MTVAVTSYKVVSGNHFKVNCERSISPAFSNCVSTDYNIAFVGFGALYCPYIVYVLFCAKVN